MPGMPTRRLAINQASLYTSIPVYGMARGNLKAVRCLARVQESLPTIILYNGKRGHNGQANEITTNKTGEQRQMNHTIASGNK